MYDSELLQSRSGPAKKKSSQPTLEEMVVAAIDTLTREDEGFFLLVSYILNMKFILN